MKVNTVICPFTMNREMYDRVALVVSPLLSRNFGELLPTDNGTRAWDVLPLFVEQDQVKLLLMNLESQYIGIEIKGDLQGNEEDIDVSWFTYHKPFPTLNYHEDLYRAICDPLAYLPSELKITSHASGEGGLSMNWWRSTIFDVERFFADEGVPDDGWEASPALFKYMECVQMDQVSIICTNEKAGLHLGFLFLQDEGHWTKSRSTYVVYRGAICYFDTIQEALSIAQDKLAVSDITCYTAQALYG